MPQGPAVMDLRGPRELEDADEQRDDQDPDPEKGDRSKHDDGYENDYFVLPKCPAST